MTIVNLPGIVPGGSRTEALRSQQRALLDRKRAKQEQKQRERYQLGDWLAIDGEGWGVDSQGRQLYRLMTAATEAGFSSSLVAAGDRLSTVEIFRWLISLPDQLRRSGKARRGRRLHLCGFALGYDYAHFVTDMADASVELLRQLHESADFESEWIKWDDFELKITAGRLALRRRVHGQVVGSVVLWDVFKYFQSSFLRAASGMMTEEERTLIEAGKVRRSESEHVVTDEIAYATAECRVLSRLMSKMELQIVRGLDLHPRMWFGPGQLAALALEQEGVKVHMRRDAEQPPELIQAALESYVGGRFETTGHGRLGGYLAEYDIVSAYPWGISQLPCLAHTRWEHAPAGCETAAVVPHGLYRLSWSSEGPPAGGWGPWPVRRPGRGGGFDARMLPTWPWSGSAWIWGIEALAGLRLLEQSPGTVVKVKEAWVPVVGCSCRPFAWVQKWFARRQKLKAEQNPQEKWLKLVLNSLYGKMCQNVGRSPWKSWLWAGLITAYARSRLLEGIAQDPEAVVMIATDALYSLRPLSFPYGTDLGDWEPQTPGPKNLLIVQSGFWEGWRRTGIRTSDHVSKSRGMPARFIDWQAIEQLWNQVLAGEIEWKDAQIRTEVDASLLRVAPYMGVQNVRPLQIHVGIGLAAAWGKPELLGMWMDYPRTHVFRTDKRPLQWEGPAPRPGWIWSRPADASVEVPGAKYRPGIGIDEGKLLVLDQPDAEEWGYVED